MSDPVIDNSDGLNDRLTASLPAMIADVTDPIRAEARKVAQEADWLAGVNWAITKMREGIGTIDIGILALNHYSTLAHQRSTP